MITVPPVVLTPKYHLEAIKLEATAYTTSYEDCGKIDGITASGTSVRYGVIAAPVSIDFGTEILIEGKKFRVEDRGGAIIQKGDTYVIDVWLPSTEECKQFGRRHIKGWKIVYDN